MPMDSNQQLNETLIRELYRPTGKFEIFCMILMVISIFAFIFMAGGWHTQSKIIELRCPDLVIRESL